MWKSEKGFKEKSFCLKNKECDFTLSCHYIIAFFLLSF